MATIRVSNGYSSTLDGLGKYKPIGQLSEKRVSKAVREVLRSKYGIENVRVSCAATYDGSKWKGEIKVKGISFGYEISI